MISKLAMTAKKTIDAAWLNGEAYDLATQAAEALESAQLLQSPETAAELARLRARMSVARALHVKHSDSEHCQHDAEPWPCPTLRALGDTDTGASPAAEADRLTRTFAPTQALRAEDPDDLCTVAPAWHADAAYIPGSKTITLELTASPEQWRAWQEALKVDLERTTHRGSCVTSHATWRGTHVVILCSFADTPPLGVAE